MVNSDKEHYEQALINGLLRSKGNVREFRQKTTDIANTLAYRCKEKLKNQDDDNIVLIPVMRAGVGFLPMFIQHMPLAQMHFIVAERNGHTIGSIKTRILWNTLNKVPTGANVILLEPMLATGGTMEKIIDLTNEIVNPKSITITSAFSSKIAEYKLWGKADIITLMGELEISDEGYIYIPNYKGSLVTLDFGDEFCGTT